MSKTRSLCFLFFFMTLLSSCEDEFVPKPKGYFRIDFPEKKYNSYSHINCNFSFEIPVYSIVSPDKSGYEENCWLNINFPIQNGTLHVSYKSVQNNLNQFTEDSRALVYKHTVKASAINEQIINFPSKKVYGVIYSIEGNTASGTQFYLTDSLSNFIRGALYFNVIPNADSLAPVAHFIQEDIEHLIHTFEWSNKNLSTTID